MLWYKGWLETRFRMLFMIAFAVFPIALTLAASHPASPEPHSASYPSVDQAESAVGFFAMYYSIIPLFLAGSGVKTESARMKRGLHGSMYFTLSLPVSRFRLFATRAGLGMLEVAAIFVVAPFAVWIRFVEPADHVTHSNLFAFWGTLSVCATAFYFLGVLLSTFLDEGAQGWISMFGLVFLYGLLSKVPRLGAANIFRAMISPLFPPHSIPWASMGLSLGVAAVLGFAALKIVQTRDY